MLLVWFATTAIGHDRPYFESVGDLESIPDGVVTAMAQDAEGFIWIGTTRGLVRFDGYDFRRHTRRRNDPHGLPGNLVRSLLASADGGLWIGTDNDGLAYFDPDNKRFIAYRHDPGDVRSLPAGSVMALAEASDGSVWVGSRGGGLARIARDQDGIQRHGTSPADGMSPLHDYIYALLLDRRGDLWIGSRAGLSRMEAGADAAEPWRPPAGIRAPTTTVYSLQQTEDGRIWVGTRHGDLLILDPDGDRAHWIDDAPRAESQEFDSISVIRQLNNGEVWLGRNQGIDIRAADSGALLRRLRHDPARPSGIAGNDIRALLQDRAGWLWVGGFGGGVQRHDPGNLAIRVLRGIPGHDDVLAQPNVNSILELPDGSLWLGTRGQGIAVLDAELRLVAGFAPRPEQVGTLAVGWITALVREPGGRIWIGSREGLHHFDPDTRTFARHRPTRGSLTASVRSLLAGSDDRLWIGTDNGLFRLDPEDDAIERIEKRGQRALAGEVNALAEDEQGRLWIGTSTGLYLLDAAAEVARRVTGRLGHELAHPTVLGLLIDRQGSLWVDTTEGLHLARDIDGDEPAFEPVSARFEHVSDDFGANLLEDATGRIWTHRYVYDPASDRLHALTRSDGVDFGTGWFRAYAAKSDGRLLFGGSRGLLVIDPSAYRVWDYAPPLVVTELRIDGRVQPLARLRPQLELTPDQRSFGLEFAALDLSAPERLRYAYRLDGVDAHWIDTDALRRTANYRNLWPGEYRLRVRGSNRSGDFSPHEIDIRVRVLPAWWQTVPFIALVAVAAALLALIVLRLRTEAIRRRAHELAALVAQRTQELSRAKEHAETALADLQRAQHQLVAAEKMASLGQLVAGVAHEINTPIGVAVTAASHLHQVAASSEARLSEGQLTRNELNDWREAVQEGAQLVLGSLERAARLIGSFKQVAVDQSSEQRRRFDLLTFLNEVRTALTPSYRRTGHRLEIECPQGIELDTYPGALFQVLTNLIQNSLLHAFEGRNDGLMLIRAERAGSRLVLRFSDDGCGMSTEVALHAFDPFFTTRRGGGGSGLGLHLVYNLSTRLLGGDIELDSTPGKGSAFVLTMPLTAPRRRPPAEGEPPPLSAP